MVEKKLEDYQKEHIVLSKEFLDTLPYPLRVQVFNDHPEAYRCAMDREPPRKDRPTGHKWSSQVRYDE